MAALIPYGSLVGINARGPAFVEVVKSQFHDLLRSLVKAIEVDEDWYLSTYTDVARAVQVGEFRSAIEHYRQAGYFEDRMPRRIVVDDLWYRSTYNDVAQAMQAGHFTTAQQHFEKDGFREGRLPSEGWRL